MGTDRKVTDNDDDDSVSNSCDTRKYQQKKKVKKQNITHQFVPKVSLQ